MDMDEALDLSVVVPVYNEIDNVVPLVERVRATLDPMGMSWELVAVDDGSTDGSGERLDELARSEDRLRVLHFEKNCGQSAGLDAGFQHARGELVALLDADLQTFPEDLPKLLEVLESEGLDAVVGIRAERRDTGWKRFSSRFANGVRNRLTLPTLLRMEGYTVKQVPVRHADRTAGTSKYGTWDRAFSGLRDALAVRWMQDRRMRWRLRD